MSMKAKGNFPETKKARWEKTKLAWPSGFVLAIVSITMLVWSGQQRPPSSSIPVMRKMNAPPTFGIRKLAALEDPTVLNIHVVPHTHDDVGWLKTVEEYYYGLNATIYDACVRDILDTVVEALMENPNRTFTYVEMKFFSMWWKEQSDAIRDAVRFLVANQQLTFSNGGWCMHDEATTHFMGMIDQTTLGHQFLKNELGVIPKVGWQLDPFGHSATQASLLTAALGFDALYFGRIDYQDLALRHDTQECEGLWASSPSLGANTSNVFWGLTGSYAGNYGPPDDFCFDKLCSYEALTNMNRTALQKKITRFLEEIKLQSDRTKGNHIMLTMGSDFNYQRAGTYFANLDLLIGSVQRFQQWGLVNVTAIVGPQFDSINIFYSSPEYYTKAKYQETLATVRSSAVLHQFTPHQHIEHRHSSTMVLNQRNKMVGVQWAVKQDDFFPYSDSPHSFWTGYFSSRIAFKRLERVASTFLLAARQIEAFPENATDAFTSDCTSRCDCNKPLYELEDAMGVVQHHDAVSGTAKQHVANDYSKRVQAGINKAADFVVAKLRRLLAKDANSFNDLDNLSYCQLINETICEVSQAATKKAARDLYVVVYNALGSNHSAIVRLPVSSNGTFDVTKLGGVPCNATSVHSSPSPFAGSLLAQAQYVLLFNTGPLPPTGATVFRITKSVGDTDNHVLNLDFEQAQRNLEVLHGKNGASEIVASNGLITVHFNRESGAMTSVSASGTSVNINQSWGYYTSFDDTMDNATDDSAGRNQNSGAYIFRPSTPGQSLKTIGYLPNSARFVNTSVGMEVHVEFSESWIKQVTRVMKDLPYVEVEYSVGPIPIDDGRGKEIVTRFFTPIRSKGDFFTDSNGREFMKRHRDSRPSWPLRVFEPVAGNYYPVNAAIYIEDEASSLSILVDRTQGGSSLYDGSVELMAHRRTLADDHRGVDEPMNETDGGVTPYPPYGHAQRWGMGIVVRGIYRIMVGKGMTGASLARSEMDSTFAAPLIFVASSHSAKNEPKIRDSFSALQQKLPPNIMLITFKKIAENDTKYLVRLGHQYGVNDDPILSMPVPVDLSTLFAKFKLVGVKEMTLSANQRYNDWVGRRLDWGGSGQLPRSTVDDTNTIVNMKPMEVRSFLLQLVPT